MHQFQSVASTLLYVNSTMIFLKNLILVIFCRMLLLYFGTLLFATVTKDVKGQMVSLTKTNEKIYKKKSDLTNIWQYDI